MTSKKTPPQVPAGAKQGGETRDPRTWEWVETSVWTERMLAALGNGVKGGKWFSLIDKVWNPRTLEAAWKLVASKRGAAGVDRVSTDRFKSNAEHYLTEISEDIRTARHVPSPVRRVEIPKEDGSVK